MMMKKQGFTLIELLVVISVLAVLMAFLTGAVNGIKQAAERIDCGACLRNWGMVLTSYAQDRRGALPIPVFTQGRTWDPSMMWCGTPSASFANYGGDRDNYINEINTEGLTPYMAASRFVSGGPHPTTHVYDFSKGFACPSYIKECGKLSGCWDNGGGTTILSIPGYLLFTGTDDPRSTGNPWISSIFNHPRLSGSTLARDSARILMADAVYGWTWGPPSTIGYHRAIAGQGFYYNGGGTHSVPVLGGNVLTADGAVRWRKMSSADNDVFRTLNDPVSTDWFVVTKGWAPGGPGGRFYIPEPQ